ncbi:hypothetical protein [Streptomyces sp. NPDC001714]|uniref:hypothetical protein n=1 Tax=Streptomyces sp. NPDC001714 TaxID=3364603 RepID=UPI0036764D3E
MGGVKEFAGKLPARRKATDTARDRLDQALRGRDDNAAGSVRESLGRLGVTCRCWSAMRGSGGRCGMCWGR